MTKLFFSARATLFTFLFVCLLPLSLRADDYSIRALLVAELESVISGELPATIRKMHVDIGDYFKEGQPLVEFDCENLKAELRKARAELNEAESVHQVNSRLQEFKSIGDLEVAVSAARLEKAKAEVSLWEVRQQKCEIKAPFSGRVLARKASPHEHVTPGQPLLELIDTVHLSLQLFVPSSWLSWMKSDVTFPVTIDETGKKYSAKVTVLGAKVHPVSQTIEIRAEIAGNHP